MIKEATGYGDSVTEAKEKALAELNVSEDADVQFEVIAREKKKVLGLFGGRRAQVRVFVELPDEKPKAARKNGAKPQNKPNHKKQSQPVKEEKRSQPVKETKKNPAAPKKAPAEKLPSARKESHGEVIDLAAVSADSKLGKAILYLKEILAHLGCTKLSMKATQEEDTVLIQLDGEGLGVLIGRHGEMLDALQYLTSLAASNGSGYCKISLNIGDYREKREEALVALTNRMAEQVLKTGKSRCLEPMNPYDRRIIHTVVQGMEGLVSKSFGEGTNRRVVIAPENGELRPPRREGRRNDSRRGDSGSRPRRPRPEPSAAPNREPKKDADLPLYGKIK